MNILYLNNVMEFGGVEKCIIQLARGFKLNNKILVATAGGPLVKELEDLGIPHNSILNTDAKDPYSIIVNLYRITKLIRREKIDLVHSHHRMTTLYCKILSKFMKFKLIHTQHLCIEDKINMTKFTLNNIPIITVSNGARENLINKYALQKSNITTIYNTVEIEDNNCDIDKNLIYLKKNGKFTVAHISRLVEYKGIYDFLKIAKKIRNKEKDIKFVIIGDGPERKNVEQFIKSNNLEETVFLLGSKSNIINQLKYIDLVLLCSYIEGLPLVPLEAFSQKTPVIASNISGTNEEVEDGINGFLVEKQDIDKFSERILWIYKNKDHYIKFCNNSLECFNKKFNKDRYLNEHLKIYKEILKLKDIRR